MCIVLLPTVSLPLTVREFEDAALVFGDAVGGVQNLEPHLFDVFRRNRVVEFLEVRFEGR